MSHLLNLLRLCSCVGELVGWWLFIYTKGERRATECVGGAVYATMAGTRLYSILGLRCKACDHVGVVMCVS